MFFGVWGQTVGLSFFTDFHNLIRRDRLGVRLSCDGHAGHIYGPTRHLVGGRAPSRGGLVKWSWHRDGKSKVPNLFSQVSRAWEAVRGGCKLHSIVRAPKEVIFLSSYRKTHLLNGKITTKSVF